MSVPFQIFVRVTAKSMLRTIIEEGDYVSIISSTAWKSIGSPQLVPITSQILGLNIRPTEPLRILPQLPITLGGKMVCIDVIVV